MLPWVVGRVVLWASSVCAEADAVPVMPRCFPDLVQADDHPVRIWEFAVARLALQAVTRFGSPQKIVAVELVCMVE